MQATEQIASTSDEAAQPPEPRDLLMPALLSAAGVVTLAWSGLLVLGFVRLVGWLFS